MDPSIVPEVTQNDDPTMVSWSRVRPPLLRSVVPRRAGAGCSLADAGGQDGVTFLEISAEVMVAGPSARHRRLYDYRLAAGATRLSAPSLVHAPLDHSGAPCAPGLCLGSSCWDAISEMHDAVSEPALVEELQVAAIATRQRGLASTDDHGPDEEPALVNQPRLERLCR